MIPSASAVACVFFLNAGDGISLPITPEANSRRSYEAVISEPLGWVDSVGVIGVVGIPTPLIGRICHPYCWISVSCGTAKAFTHHQPSFTSSTFDDEPISGGDDAEIDTFSPRGEQGNETADAHCRDGGLSGYRFLQIIQHQAYHLVYLPVFGILRQCGTLAYITQAEAAGKKNVY